MSDVWPPRVRCMVTARGTFVGPLRAGWLWSDGAVVMSALGLVAWGVTLLSHMVADCAPVPSASSNKNENHCAYSLLNIIAYDKTISAKTTADSLLNIEAAIRPTSAASGLTITEPNTMVTVVIGHKPLISVDGIQVMLDNVPNNYTTCCV